MKPLYRGDAAAGEILAEGVDNFVFYNNSEEWQYYFVAIVAAYGGLEKGVVAVNCLKDMN